MQKQRAVAEREPVVRMVKTAREEGEEDKRSWCVFRGDLVRDIASTV